MIWLLIAYFLARVELIITAKHYDNQYVGWGAIPWTLRKVAPAPMRYRVLVPWVVGWIKTPEDRLNAYGLIKWLSLAVALWLVSLAWNWQVAVVTALLIPVTFEFDSWNWPIEMGAIAVGMLGSMPLALVAGVLLAMSKETAPLVAVAYWSVTGDVTGAVIVFLGILGMMLIVRIIQGEAELYCERVMIRRNWREIREKIRSANPRLFAAPVASLSISILILLSITSFVPGWIVPLSLLVAGWTLAVASETRIFVSALPWVAAWLIGVMSV